MFVTCVYEKFQKTSSLVRTSTQTNISSGSHVAIDNLLDIDNGFWPPKLILATQTPETICYVPLRTNVKKRVVNHSLV